MLLGAKGVEIHPVLLTRLGYIFRLSTALRLHDSRRADTLPAMDDSKKARELAVVRIFLEAARITATPRPGERPDFLLELEGGERVGLEVTGLTDPARKASSSAMERRSDPRRSRTIGT